MKVLLQTGSSGQVPVPPEKRFLINWYDALDQEVFSAPPPRQAVVDLPVSNDREVRMWTSRKGSELQAKILKRGWEAPRHICAQRKA